MNNTISLTYLPKKYKAYPFTHNERIIGGRLTNIDTFYTCCGEKLRKDADWIINKSIQSMDETTMEFSFVGLSEVLKQPVIVKMMLNNPQSRREVKVQQFFKKHPHRNIVQGICEFKCQDNPIKWKVKLKGPKQMCNPNRQYEISEFIIIIQEYIKLGDLDDYGETINYYKWKSLITQMLYGSLELFEKYGFFYDDWKLRNILVDETDERTVIYNCFGREWIVPNTFGLTPVLTDFSLCRVLEKTPENLAYQLSFCLDTFGRICPNRKINKLCMDLAIEIEQIDNLDNILDTLSKFVSTIPHMEIHTNNS